MGDRLTEDQEPQQTSPHPYGDILEELLPRYMAMGMPYDAYWDGEYGMKTAYRKAYKIRILEDQKLADQSNWLMGQYVLSVLQASPLLVAGLNVKRGASLPHYPDKPFLFGYEERQKEEAKQRKEEDQTKLAMAMFQASIEKFNQNFQKRQEAEKAKAESSGQHE